MSTWFDTARFGMFISWGPSSQKGWELSWPLLDGIINLYLPYCQNLTVEEYYSITPTFNPTDYDPRELARMAKRAGMTYAVLTTKHHDGYAMFHTKYSDFSIENSPYQKDIVREFVEAFRAEGLRTGLYFSLIDWHHPDYPAFQDTDRQYYASLSLRQPTKEQWDRYLEFMFSQVRELLTNYGKIDVIWFDGQWERSPDQLKTKELRDMIKSLQPEILIDDRLTDQGDFDTPEQFVPAEPQKRMWETCMTMNTSWGYNPTDPDYKTTRELIHTLCEVAAKGGNLLLNVSPMGNGKIPDEQIKRLETIETWMVRNRESIVGTVPGLEPWQFYGPSTRKGNTIYLHLLMKPYETVSIKGIPVNMVKSVRVLGTGEELGYKKRIPVVDILIQNPTPKGELIVSVPDHAVDPYATVIAIDFAQTS
ncbi:MAG: alpha-L-fucosidase [Halobacteriota archaeon]